MSSAPVDPVDIAAPTAEPGATEPVKRQRRRKAKQPKEADPEAITAEQAETPEPEGEDTEKKSEEELKNPYIEIVQKRVRNLQKRKQRLDKYEEQAATPDAAKLNQDQVAALKSKDQVVYPLKELEELTKSFKIIDEEQQQQKLKETKSHNAQAQKQKIKDSESHAAEVLAAADKAKKEALAEARERISVLVKFLHVASWKRQFASTAASEAESAAFESLLSLIYAGDDAAVEAVYKLSDGADELVDEEATTQRSLTFETIRQLSLESLDELYSRVQEATPAGSVDDNIVIAKTDVEDDDDDKEPISSVVKIPRGGISFLNESELDQEDETSPVAPPPQTIADEVSTEVPARPPPASQVDDDHANYAGATEWAENQPPAVLPTEPAVATAEPVWEQSVAPDTPSTTGQAPSKQPQRQQILSNSNAGSGRGGRYRGQGQRGRGGGINNANGNGGERRGGRGYFRNRGGRQDQQHQHPQSQQQIST
ncbi:hypothetical protein V1525DRAFT_403704 [Lipomyces kononenkoae]|uniref:Uncharacterized protein n=1 Tax=Lipomyces kononenkoae TaxID=34357 RepID=A0ACC3T0V1_LIPKO